MAACLICDSGFTEGPSVFCERCTNLVKTGSWKWFRKGLWVEDSTGCKVQTATTMGFSGDPDDALTVIAVYGNVVGSFPKETDDSLTDTHRRCFPGVLSENPYVVWFMAKDFFDRWRPCIPPPKTVWDMLMEGD
jgi:hypothetical protein